MATLTVGPSAQYQTIAAAIAVADNGDTVAVQSGTYTNDFLDFAKDVTLQAVGGVVTMLATVSPPDGKAMITESGDVSIKGFDVSGVSVPDGNGAAVRYQGGRLTLTDVNFHNNQDGLLGAPDPTGTITVKHSEFAFNGVGGDGHTHGLYAGILAHLTITDSYFHDTSVGHEIKSRAAFTEIVGNRILDNGSSSSYSVDLPNGGNATITGNVIEQGPNGQNPAIFEYGAEGQSNPGTDLRIDNNTIVNDRGGNSYALLNATTVQPSFNGNTVYGLDATHVPAGATTFVTDRPTVDTSALSLDQTPSPAPPPPPSAETPPPVAEPPPTPTPTPTPEPTPTPTPSPPPTPTPDPTPPPVESTPPPVIALPPLTAAQFVFFNFLAHNAATFQPMAATNPTVGAWLSTAHSYFPELFPT